MPKQHLTVRVSDETINRLTELRAAWGGVRSLSIGETIEEAVARAAQAEERAGKKSARKSPVPS